MASWRQSDWTQPLQNKLPNRKAKDWRGTLKPCNGRPIYSTQDIFDKIKETEPGVDGEDQLTDALTKMDDVYGVLFEGKTFLK